MTPELVLLLGGIASAILGLIGIAKMRAATPIRELLSEAERVSFDNQILVTQGKHLCPGCSIRYIHLTVDFCDVCEKLRTLQARSVNIQPREPEHIVKNEVRRGTRSHVGYRPLYMQDGFADLFEKGDEQ